jgi:RNA polymerase subunit RPABC4/transcription elongation factor Spt4
MRRKGKKKKSDQDENKIRFFCDKCGFEVEQDTKTCPGCGRSFSSVKCTVCEFVGEAELFVDGCPVCGFSPSSPQKTQNTQTVQAAQTVQKNQNAPFISAKVLKRLHYDLPVWIYAVTFLALGVSLAALYLNITR